MMKHYALLVMLASTFFPNTSKAQNLDDFQDKGTYFYLSPSEKAFNEFQKSAEDNKNEILRLGNGSEIITSVMLARINAKYNWPLTDNIFGTIAKEILVGKSPLAKYVNDDSQVTPNKIDIWWASFFATGEDIYLKKIFNYVGKIPDKSDDELTVLILVSSWSFKSICQQHDKVLGFAKQMLVSDSILDSQALFLKLCIDSVESDRPNQEDRKNKQKSARRFIFRRCK